jgi:hypothetical protein
MEFQDFWNIKVVLTLVFINYYNMFYYIYSSICCHKIV